MGRLLALLTGARCVATYHPSVLGNIEKVQNAPQSTFSPVQVLFFNLFFPHTLILMSEESLRHLRRYVLFGKSRIAKVYGGVDTVHFRPPSDAERRDARAKFGVADGEFMCLLAARLAWVKGHDLLIKAARKIRDSASSSPIDIKCYFVGSGGAEREKEIKSFAYAGEKDKDTFKFLGFMGDVREILWAADVFALPSRFEGFPLGVAEAMATGLVPVRTRRAARLIRSSRARPASSCRSRTSTRSSVRSRRWPTLRCAPRCRAMLLRAPSNISVSGRWSTRPSESTV
ncbi:glycosyltransferase family 4 protein [Bradyrhizobium japonicum]